MSQPSGGLYLHVPFCSRVCPYCDFAVRTGDRQRRRKYVEHLLSEIELYADYPQRFDTIYFGGGTPSCLEPGDLGRIVEAIGRSMHLEEDTRLFLEANPEDVSPDSVAAWRKLGIDTLSLGVQSLNDDGLRFLGRLHDAETARRSVELARHAGFRTLSIDLIYGLPDQSASDWRGEMDRALALGPDHMSCYQLTIHPGTRFGALEKRGKLAQLPLDVQADLFGLTHRHLNEAGMQGYEVSQFAVDSRHRSRHNMKYWDHSPYLGLGPSAHSYGAGRRWWNLRRTSAWQEAVEQGRRPVEGSESLDARALTLEALMTGLRTYAGVDLEEVRQRWGVDLRVMNAVHIERLATEDLAALDGDRLVPTAKGLAVADSLATLFDLVPGDASPADAMSSWTH